MKRINKRRSRLPVVFCVAGGILIFVVEMFASRHMTNRRIEQKTQEKARYMQEHSPASSPISAPNRIKVFIPSEASPSTGRNIENAAAP